jgi:hypothetical protein
VKEHFIELFNDHDYRQSCIQFCIKTKCDRLYTILQKNGGTDTKAHRTPVPVWPNVGQKKKVFANSVQESMSMTRRIQNAQPCVGKMQFIFFVPPNKELEGTLHPQQFWCTPKNEGKRVHVPPDEKTCGHAVQFNWLRIFLEDKHKILLQLSICYEYQQFFQHRICFSIQPPDYSDPWPTLARYSSFCS